MGMVMARRGNRHGECQDSVKYGLLVRVRSEVPFVENLYTQIGVILQALLLNPLTFDSHSQSNICNIAYSGMPALTENDMKLQ